MEEQLSGGIWAVHEAEKKNKLQQAEEYRLRGWKNVTIRPHDLRHSFCEWCITNGIDLKTVSAWMGHSDQKMIMQVYDHVTVIRELNAAQKLNALFQQAE